MRFLGHRDCCHCQDIWCQVKSRGQSYPGQIVSESSLRKLVGRREKRNTKFRARVPFYVRFIPETPYRLCSISLISEVKLHTMGHGARESRSPVCVPLLCLLLPRNTKRNRNWHQLMQHALLSPRNRTRRERHDKMSRTRKTFPCGVRMFHVKMGRRCGRVASAAALLSPDPSRMSGFEKSRALHWPASCLPSQPATPLVLSPANLELFRWRPIDIFPSVWVFPLWSFFCTC